MKSFLALCLCVVVSSVVADIYLHTPRGSNNRLQEANRGRNNANRLFDSQNNNRGGSNVGNVYFYTGSQMNIEWTNQHSCGGPNNHCEIIIQYTCDNLLRDGSTTNTITESAGADKDPKFGRHESYSWYSKECKYRSRNKGLFVSNENLQGNGAIYTRQNPNGQRFGFECPEERDYYPYWHPTVWRDIAVFTNQPGRCDAYRANSQNVAARQYCQAPADWVSYQSSLGRTGFIPVNKTECEAIKSLYEVDEYNVTKTGVWATSAPWGIDPPLCQTNTYSRDNHLGNTNTGFPINFNWTVSEQLLHERCVLRIRYNISTADFAGFALNDIAAPANLTSRNNSHPTQTTNRDVALIDVYSVYGLAWTDVNVSYNTQTNNPNNAAIKNSRDYVLKDNPRVDIFGPLIDRTQTGDPNQPAMIRLQLAINTNQFGRTFEDRSHRFAIRSAPAELNGARILNVQVKGKRGNIVQTFPGTEYDFYPKFLQVQNGEYVHFQWTGSNTNPGNNAGNGAASTDRHNVVLLRAPVYPYIQAANQRALDESGGTMPRIGQLGSNYPSRIDLPNSTFLGFSYEDKRTLAILNPSQMGGNMDQGNDAGTYFDLGPRKATVNGIFNYVATRNNDFSNRDQKAQITVSDGSAHFAALGQAGGSIRSTSGDTITVNANVFTSLITVTLISYKRDTPSSFSGPVQSNYVQITPMTLPLVSGQTITVSIPYDDKPLIIPQLYHSDSLQGSWSTVPGASYSGGEASADVSEGGVYVVQTQVNWGGVVGVAVGALAFVGIVIGVSYWYYRKHKLGGGDDKKSTTSV